MSKRNSRILFIVLVGLFLLSISINMAQSRSFGVTNGKRKQQGGGSCQANKKCVVDDDCNYPGESNMNCSKLTKKWDDDHR